MTQNRTIGYAGVLAVAALALAGGEALAQEKANTGVNANSVRAINENDIMMKKTLWRRIDLKEKQNQSMFSKNNEISKYLIEAVKAGLIDAYTNDSCTTKISADKFHENMLIPNTGGGLSAEEKAAGFTEDGKTAGADDGWGGPAKDKKKPADDGWGTPKKAAAQPADDGWGAPKKKSVASTKKGKKGKVVAPPVVEEVKKDTVAAAAPAFSGDEYFPKELNILEVKEDWIFDRKRSRLYYDMQTVTLLLPADKNQAGYEKPIASFKYKDLDKLFRSDPKKFIWYNPQNQAQHKNLADAFDLRLFYGRITKVANPGDTDLVGMYGDREGLLKSYQTEYELMETEHGLWEY
ncbi:type IX secretion system ring subunit PorN/GldN [Spirosoma radiotolerans]|uniref:Gliding motility associated protein GldN n=1 Tax=Spirosoma radiotolerans TaxID=1379870 RepID=A0A0E3V8L4_9BACT|nr:gliding motility protein GldN [Spirosoma radiotolerans]AKD56406.1 gliding motility associated protein GldN [Spirosoma radiotolerans]